MPHLMTRNDAIKKLERAGLNYDEHTKQFGMSLHPNDALVRIWDACDELAPGIGNDLTHDAWTIAWQMASALGPIPAIQTMQRMAMAIGTNQVDTGEWDHKGLPFFWIWHTCRSQGWDWQWRRYAILTLIEDAMRDVKDCKFPSENSGAWREATRDFGINQEDLDELGNTVIEAANQYQSSEKWTDIIFSEIRHKSKTARRILQSPMPLAFFEPVIADKKPLTQLLEGTIATHYSQGKSLEKLLSILFGALPGSIVRENVRGLFEVDVYVDLSVNTQLSMQLAPRVIIECKDYQKPVTVQVAAKLMSVCQTANTSLGIIVAKKGITGQTKMKNATRAALQSYLQFGISMVVLTENDLEQVIESGNLVGLLAEKVADARLGIF